jgi:hypothetical protein
MVEYCVVIFYKTYKYPTLEKILILFRNRRPLILLLVTIVSSILVTQQSIGMFTTTTVSASESSNYESGRDQVVMMHD